MTVTGYSIETPESGETTPTSEETITGHTEQLKAIVDRLMWVGRRIAALSDQDVEPEDITIDDLLRNMEREA